MKLSDDQIDGLLNERPWGATLRKVAAVRVSERRWCVGYTADDGEGRYVNLYDRPCRGFLDVRLITGPLPWGEAVQVVAYVSGKQESFRGAASLPPAPEGTRP